MGQRILIPHDIDDLGLDLLGAIIRNLDDAQSINRCAAVEAVSRVGRKGDKDAIEAVGWCLEDSHEAVRRAAVDAITVLAGPKSSGGACGSARPAMDVDLGGTGMDSDAGTSFALDVIARRLDHQDATVRRSALKAMGALARQGDRAAFSHIADRLSSNQVVSGGACGVTSGSGPRSAITRPAGTSVGAPDSFIRRAAARAVGQLLQKDCNFRALEVLARRTDPVAKLSAVRDEDTRHVYAADDGVNGGGALLGAARISIATPRESGTVAGRCSLTRGGTASR